MFIKNQSEDTPVIVWYHPLTSNSFIIEFTKNVISRNIIRTWNARLGFMSVAVVCVCVCRCGCTCVLDYFRLSSRNCENKTILIKFRLIWECEHVNLVFVDEIWDRIFEHLSFYTYTYTTNTRVDRWCCFGRIYLNYTVQR